LDIGTTLKTILIIGASRGLGLEFVRQYRHDGWEVISTHRRAVDGKKLAALGAETLILDTTDVASIAAFVEALGKRSLDVAIYNAGVYGPREASVTAPTSIKDFDSVMHANVFGAMQLIPIVAPRLIKNKGTFAFISSMMGSIGGMSSPNGVIYRASKAALNAVVKAASLEYASKDIKAFVMHPGWVQTDMGGANADITPEVSITGMRKVIAGASAKHNGGFFNYTGEEIAW
jgi:NAD(P)-dependent dehydrogenase (short-subunit alcohol dehydrogenase family)